MGRPGGGRRPRSSFAGCWRWARRGRSQRSRPSPGRASPPRASRPRQAPTRSPATGRSARFGWCSPSSCSTPAGARHLAGLATLDLEGLTIPQGELPPAIGAKGSWIGAIPTPTRTSCWSRGTTAGPAGRPGTLSLTAGKGFAPFGTDDPMIRPALRYPVNHHLAQILERAVVIGAGRRDRSRWSWASSTATSRSGRTSGR